MTKLDMNDPNIVKPLFLFPTERREKEPLIVGDYNAEYDASCGWSSGIQ